MYKIALAALGVGVFLVALAPAKRRREAAPSPV